MSTNIKIIKFLSVIAILTIAITYVIHLNIEFGFFVLNTPWISNNFVFTIFSGAFASVVIALMMESRQYALNKVHAKNQIFGESILLLSHLYIVKDTLLRVKEQPNSTISPDVFICSVTQCEHYIDSLHNIDYHPIIKSDKFVGNLEELYGLIDNRIAPILLNSKLIQQAVLKDKLLELEKTGKSTNPTYNSYYSRLTTDKLLEDIIPIFEELKVRVQKIASTVNQQRRFVNIYKNLTRFEKSHDLPSLEKYLGL